MSDAARDALPLDVPALASPRRLVSLDVLRGLAILLMIGSGMLPKSLPNWVDHGYQPHYRPDGSGMWASTLVDGAPPFDPRWKAFTWVDLVFPMFLFSMGTAIPLALSRRLDRGHSKRSAIATIAGRAVTLALFGVIVTQMTAWQLTWPNSSPDAARGRVMLAFVGAFLFFVRWRSGTPPGVALASRGLGLAIVVGLILAGARRGAAFAWGESDTIILVLAHTYFVAATLWVLTRGWRWGRLVAIAPLLLLAHYLQLDADKFGDWLWLGAGPLTLRPIVTFPNKLLNAAWWSPDVVATWPAWPRTLANLSPLWNVTWYKFLWCVVPGTIVGDRLIAWSTTNREVDARRSPRRTIAALTLAIATAVFVGLRHYGLPTLGLGGPLATPWLSLTLALPLIVTLAIVVRRTSSDATHRWLLHVGVACLLTGLALACLPSSAAREHFFEGGISKGSPATMSYYATSVGLCVLLLLGLLVTIDGAPRRDDRSRPGLVEANGQNPMLAYFLAHSTVGALLSFGVFAPLNAAIAASVWLDTSVGVLKTALIALVVWLVTRRRIVWRA